jgi:hypothetical protein
MKKLVFVLAGLILVTAINAQSLEEIVKKYTTANKLDQVTKLKTVKITANMSMMGMEMPMVMWMKNPDKVKTVTSFNGQDIISVFDGVKGFQINPMAGSTEPVEMTSEQAKQTLNSNVFQNYMLNYFNKGQLALAGEDKVNDKPAYKLKATIDGGTVIDLYIDKASFLLAKTVSSVNQGGTAVTVEAYPSNYTETNGLLLPMKTTTSAGGMEFVVNFTKVEVDIPMDDSVFKIK